MIHDMPQDDFISLAERQLAELVRDDASLAAQEDGVRRKRAELQERIEVLRASVKVYRDVMGIGAESPPPPVGLFDDIPMGTIADMAYAVVRKHGEPMKVADIARVLAATGKLQSGEGSAHANYGTVYGTLQRDKRFERLDQGRFGLAASANGTGPSALVQPS